ncbi:unnamed protein product, partial [Callosobruchus maculatus]
GRTLELHSPDAVHSCVLRAVDVADAVGWFNALHSVLARLTQLALRDAVRCLPMPELRHPPLSSSDSSDDSPSAWQSVFAVVTDLEVRFYEAAPWSAEAWRAPAEAYPLAAARLVAASSMQGGGQRTTEFGVRCATTRGVVAHRLRTETHRDLAQWARHLVEGAHHSAVQQRELVCKTTGAGARTLWRYPFDRLQASSDDGKRFLWLDFGPGEDTDVELDLEGCPKPVSSTELVFGNIPKLDKDFDYSIVFHWPSKNESQ